MRSTEHSNQRSERLEARVTAEQKELFQFAADLQGITLTDFTISALKQEAIKIIQEYEMIRLSLKDQATFAETLFNPPKPSKNLLKAAKRYQKEVKK